MNSAKHCAFTDDALFWDGKIKRKSFIYRAESELGYTRMDFLHLGGYDEARVRVAAPPQRHMAKQPSVIIRHPSSQS